MSFFLITFFVIKRLLFTIFVRCLQQFFNRLEDKGLALRAAQAVLSRPHEYPISEKIVPGTRPDRVGIPDIN